MLPKSEITLIDSSEEEPVEPVPAKKIKDEPHVEVEYEVFFLDGKSFYIPIDKKTPKKVFEYLKAEKKIEKQGDYDLYQGNKLLPLESLINWRTTQRLQIYFTHLLNPYPKEKGDEKKKEQHAENLIDVNGYNIKFFCLSRGVSFSFYSESMHFEDLFNEMNEDLADPIFQDNLQIILSCLTKSILLNEKTKGWFIKKILEISSRLLVRDERPIHFHQHKVIMDHAIHINNKVRICCEDKDDKLRMGLIQNFDQLRTFCLNQNFKCCFGIVSTLTEWQFTCYFKNEVITSQDFLCSRVYEVKLTKEGLETILRKIRAFTRQVFKDEFEKRIKASES